MSTPRLDSAPGSAGKSGGGSRDQFIIGLLLVYYWFIIGLDQFNIGLGHLLFV